MSGAGPWHVVVLSWNGREDTLTCLESLRGVPRDDVVVWCVDNGSVDGTPAAVRECFPEVRVVENGANLGYAGGNNRGIRRALDDGAAWVVLLNNDATLAPDAVDALARAAGAHPRAGILGGKVLFADPPDRIWFAGQRFRAALGYSGRPRGHGRPDGPEYDRVVATDRVVGALMAISRPALERVGLLDEDLFAYVEDVDLCVRARAAGFEVLIAPGARAWHRVSASTGGESSAPVLYYGSRNTIVVCERHRPLGRVGTALRRGVVVASYLVVAARRPGRRRSVRAVLEGWRDARARRLGPRRPAGQDPSAAS